MSRTLVRALLMVLVIAGIVPFVLPLRDGKPLLDFRAISAPPLPDVSLPSLPAAGGPSAPVTLYKWRGPDGEWQFGNTPPAPGTRYETVSVDPGANVIQAVKPQAAPVATRAAPQAAPAAAKVPTGNPVEDYSPANVIKSIDDARAVQSTLDQRKAAQDAIVNMR